MQLSSTLRLTDESITGFVKAGYVFPLFCLPESGRQCLTVILGCLRRLHIRSAWKLFEKCYAQLPGVSAYESKAAIEAKDQEQLASESLPMLQSGSSHSFNVRLPGAGFARARLLIRRSLTRTEIDKSVLGGILFGIGAFNSLISILPAMVLKLVAFFGYPSDREKVGVLVAVLWLRSESVQCDECLHAVNWVSCCRA